MPKDGKNREGAGLPYHLKGAYFYRIIHKFIDQTGAGQSEAACMARSRASCTFSICGVSVSNLLMVPLCRLIPDVESVYGGRFDDDPGRYLSEAAACCRSVAKGGRALPTAQVFQL